MSDNKTECTACGAEMIDDRKHGMTSGCGYEWLPCCSQECHDMLKDSEQGIDVRPPKTYTIRLTLTPDAEAAGELPTLDQIAAALAHSTAGEAIADAIGDGENFPSVRLELIDDQARPLDRRELATILAGLRYLQLDLDGTQEQPPSARGAIIAEILDGNPPTLEEIDALCERLNAQELSR